MRILFLLSLVYDEITTVSTIVKTVGLDLRKKEKETTDCRKTNHKHRGKNIISIIATNLNAGFFSDFMTHFRCIFKIADIILFVLLEKLRLALICRRFS